MRLFLIFIFLISIILPASGQKAVINGTIKGAEGLEIRLYSYTDMISKKEVLLARKKIDASGKFDMEIPVVKKEVVFAFFRMTDIPAGNIYLESGKKYILTFDSADYKNPNEIYNPILVNKIISFRINNADSNDLNPCIQRLNVMINDFYTRQFNLDSRTSGKVATFIRRKNVDSLKTVLEETFSKISHPYFDIYKKYSIASVYFAARTTPRLKIFNEYIRKQPVYLNNVQYMYFFDDFFNDYIFSESKDIPARDIYNNVLKKVSYTSLLDSLGKDSLLRNEVLRETVLLHNIVNWSSIPYFSIDSVKKFLNQFATQSKFDLHRMIASNLNDELFKYSQGAPAPLFTLKTIGDSSISLDNYKGKYLYLFFFTSYCKSCPAEMKALNQMPKDIADSVAVLCINMDKEPLKLFYFVQDNPLTIPMVHFGNDYLLAEEYGIVSYPQAILLNKKGEYFKYSADFPSTGLFEYLKKALKIPGQKEKDESPGYRRP